jgi:predicted Zn-dependent protease
MKKYFILLLVLLLFIPNANAKKKAEGFSTIRDEETESFLRNIAKPIFNSAGLNSNSIKIIIINEDSINAFVSGGQNIFVNTGLITELDDPDGLIGVLAHETGHIKAAHILQKESKAGDAATSLVAGYVIGIGSVLLGAPAEAGFAISSAGQQFATRNFLTYSRKYESEADSAALNILTDIGVSPKGLIDVLKVLQKRQSINAGKVDEYATTHPVNEDRMNFLQAAIDKNPVIDRATSTEANVNFKRVKAKILAFLGDITKVSKTYAGQNTDYAIYARAILAHRKGDYNTALAEIEKLIKQNPSDPYYIELKAQICYENGRINESIAAYKKALEKKPGAVLFTLKLAIAQAQLGDKANLIEAQKNLKTVLAIEPKNTLALKNIAIIYGKLGQVGISYVYLAQEALISRKFDDVKLYIKQAEARVQKNSRESKQLDDIKLELKKILD